MIKIKQNRIAVLLLLLILVGGSTLFIGRISGNVWEAQSRLEEMEEYAQASREEFLETSIALQEAGLDTVEALWAKEQETFPNRPQDVQITRFVNNLEGFLNQIYNSMIVAIIVDGEFIYTGYQNPVYEEHFYNIDWESLQTNDLTVIGDEHAEAGFTNRLFISSRRLEQAAPVIDVFIFFEEETMINSLVETYSFELVVATNDSIGRILNEILYYMAGVILFSICLTLYLRKLYIDIKTACPCKEEDKQNGRNNHDSA